MSPVSSLYGGLDGGELLAYLFNDCVHVCGNLNNTEVPLNFNWPTAQRKSPRGSLSLVSDPNNLKINIKYHIYLAVRHCLPHFRIHVTSYVSIIIVYLFFDE